MNRLYNIMIFIMFRSIVYLLILLLVIQNKIETLFNLLIIGDFKNVCINMIKNYKILTLILIVLVIVYCSNKHILNKIKGSRSFIKKIVSIKKEEPNNLIMYLSSYILPIIGSLGNLNILWIIVYEVFLLKFFLKNINFHYRLLLSFMYSEYLIVTEDGNEYYMYTKTKKLKDKIINKKNEFGILNFAVNDIEENFLWYEENN